MKNTQLKSKIISYGVSSTHMSVTYKPKPHEKYILRELKKNITKEIGKKCKDYSHLCSVCTAWQAFETLDYIFKL